MSKNAYNEKIEQISFPLGFIYDVAGKEDIAKFARKIFEIGDKAYQDIGGNKGLTTEKKFVKSAALVRLIFANAYPVDEIVNHQDEIVALECFRKVGEGFKSFLLAKNPDIPDTGKYARELIKYSIANYDKFYWAEVSGKVESLFKSYDGFPIPTVYAEDILLKHGQLELDPDGIHYYRKIGSSDDDKFRKVIYGFKDKTVFDQVLNGLVAILGVTMTYDEFRKEINSSTASDDDKVKKEYVTGKQLAVTKKLLRKYENKSDDILKQYTKYIESICNGVYEDDINELPQEMLDCILLCAEELNKSAKYSEIVEQALDVLEIVQPLEAHIFQYELLWFVHSTT